VAAICSLVVVAAACSGTSSANKATTTVPSATSPASDGSTDQGSASTPPTTPLTNSPTTAAPAPRCSIALTSDTYDGFHVGVPSGWNVFTLDGTITVSKDASGTEEVTIIPALLADGTTATSAFTTSLAQVTQEVTSTGATLHSTLGASGGTPSATLALHAGSVDMKGTARLEVLPDSTAHGTEQAAFIASWAPVARFDADRSTLDGIGGCYGPQAGSLFRIVQDQAFTYEIPPGWTTSNEGQDTIQLNDGNDASASYLLTTAPFGSGVDSAQSLLTWFLGQVKIRLGTVVSSVSAPPQTEPNGSTAGLLYEQFTGTLPDGRSAHALVNVVSSTLDGGTTGVIRMGIAITSLWNSVNGALIKAMGGIQHQFTQDLQEFQRLNLQWQNFDRNVQGFDDALNGVDLVHDPATGQNFDAPYEAYDQDGPNGPGYYDSTGNRLQIETP
jgi:hypothetical protein